MTKIVIRWVTNMVGLLVAAYLLTNIRYESTVALALAALILAVVNITIKPVLLILALPVQVITLGLFTFIINGIMLKITSALVPGFAVSGFFAAILGSIIVSIIGGLLYNVIKTEDK